MGKHGQSFLDFVRKQVQSLSRVLGSDCHNFRAQNTPGSRYCLDQDGQVFNRRTAYSTVRRQWDLASQKQSVLNTQKMISKARKKFLLKTLENSKFVKMEAVEFGFNERDYTSAQFARFT